ncbi:MAG: ABC transporter ATP-binding protein [Acidobacteria bacterium]|nr:ABC transporter ATP-binding protein [Acidobacteriota bacterium]
MTRVDVVDVEAGYGNPVLRGVTTEFRAGEMTALLGPSGCGKTTLLKVLAGLHPATGRVLFDEVDVGGMAAEKREVAMVFQKPLLFPHRDVRGNVEFGLQMRGRTGDVDGMMAMVGIGELAGRRVGTLSGGQEQRVALARALVTKPKVLLLDEPFSALDEALRGEMRSLVRELQRSLRTTTVFVTHDQEEASLVADRIVLLLGGRVEQVGTAGELYAAPATRAAAEFFGWQVLRDGRAFREARLGEVGEAGTVREVIRWARGTRYLVDLETGERVAVDEPGYEPERRGAVRVELLRYLEFS